MRSCREDSDPLLHMKFKQVDPAVVHWSRDAILFTEVLNRFVQTKPFIQNAQDEKQTVGAVRHNHVRKDCMGVFVLLRTAAPANHPLNGDFFADNLSTTVDDKVPLIRAVWLETAFGPAARALLTVGVPGLHEILENVQRIFQSLQIKLANNRFFSYHNNWAELFSSCPQPARRSVFVRDVPSHFFIMTDTTAFCNAEKSVPQ